MAILRPLTLLYYTVRLLYVVINNLMYIPCYLTYIALLYPLFYLKPEIYWTVETVLFKHLLNFVTVWIYSGGYKVVESGDDLRSLHDSHCLLLVNHQSTADVPMVMVLLQPKSMAMGRVMWVMDHLFKYTNFGLPAYYHGDYFIQQGKNVRSAQMEKLQKHLQEIYLKTFKKWIVLFPEGGFLRKRRKASQEFLGITGFKDVMTVTRYHKIMEYLHLSNSRLDTSPNHPTFDKLYKTDTLNNKQSNWSNWLMTCPESVSLYKRHLRGVDISHQLRTSYKVGRPSKRWWKYAKKNDLPILENVVLPRVGAMNVVLDTVGNAEPPNGVVSEKCPGSSCVKWVIDVTVAYPNGRPLDMHGMLIGYWPPCQTLIHYRAYPVAEIPKDIDGRTKWLYERYQEKEEMLDAYYKSHKFLDESDEKIRELPRMSRKVLQLDKISIIISYIFYTLSAYLLWIYVYFPLWGLLLSILRYLFSFIF